MDTKYTLFFMCDYMCYFLCDYNVKNDNWIVLGEQFYGLLYFKKFKYYEKKTE